MCTYRRQSKVILAARRRCRHACLCFLPMFTQVCQSRCEWFCPHKMLAWEDGRVVRRIAKGWAGWGELEAGSWSGLSSPTWPLAVVRWLCCSVVLSTASYQVPSPCQACTCPRVSVSRGNPGLVPSNSIPLISSRWQFKATTLWSKTRAVSPVPERLPWIPSQIGKKAMQKHPKILAGLWTTCERTWSLVDFTNWNIGWGEPV